MSIDITPGPGLTVDQANANLTTLRDGIYNAASYYINTVTGSYTLSVNDLVTNRNRPTIIRINTTSANALTVPPNSAVPFPVGTAIPVYFANIGATTIVGGQGVTITPAPGLPSLAQYSMRQLVQMATDVWALI